MRRRALVLVVLVSALAAAIAMARGPTSARSARAIARHILGKLELPAGSAQSRTDPSGSRLTKPGTYPATPDLLDLHSFWRAPGDPRRVFDWIVAHPPAGSSAQEAGAAGVNGSVVSRYVGFAFLAPRWGGAPSQTLLMTVTSARGGGTAVRADAQVVWLRERPAAERIPGGVDAVGVATRDSRGLRRSEQVTDRRKVARLVMLIDRLPAAQPGTMACPNDSGTSVRLAFLHRGKRLAAAFVDSGGCLIVNLWIHGHRAHALQADPSVLKQLSKALRTGVG